MPPIIIVFKLLIFIKIGFSNLFFEVCSMLKKKKKVQAIFRSCTAPSFSGSHSVSGGPPGLLTQGHPLKLAEVPGPRVLPTGPAPFPDNSLVSQSTLPPATANQVGPLWEQNCCDDQGGVGWARGAAQAGRPHPYPNFQKSSWLNGCQFVSL